MKISELLKSITFRLDAGSIQSPDMEARLIVSHVLCLEFSDLILMAGSLIDTDKLALVDKIVAERLTDRPIQYILGEADFFGLVLKVGEGVLIPRPETEVLVEKVLNLYPKSGGDILDLCTGSGAIPLALQSEIPTSCSIYGVDISDEALFYANRNCELQKGQFTDRPVHVLKGDLFEPIRTDQKFAVITSNPPYVTEEEYSELPANVKSFEPKLALTAENEGLAIIERIAKESPNYLLDGGFVICEMGWRQGEDALELFQPYFNSAEIMKDYTGRDRFILAFK